jgi:hypothetical protein
MRTNIRTIAGITAACIAGGAASVALASGTASAAKSAPARAGTSYVATTPVGGVQIVLSADRRQVRRALFAFESECSDGDSFYNYDVYAAIPISANRKFSWTYDSGPQASTTTPGATFSYKESFTGTINKARTKIVGSVRSSFAFADPAGKSYTCDTGTINFKADD